MLCLDYACWLDCVNPASVDMVRGQKDREGQRKLSWFFFLSVTASQRVGFSSGSNNNDRGDKGCLSSMVPGEPWFNQCWG